MGEVVCLKEGHIIKEYDLGEWERKADFDFGWNEGCPFCAYIKL